MMMTTTTTFELFPMSSPAMKKKFIDSARIRVGFFKRLMSRNKICRLYEPKPQLHKLKPQKTRQAKRLANTLDVTMLPVKNGGKCVRQT